ncbi:G-protein alpha subunit [Mycena metata]|uniref:G-protein alpha subunit n=1 Tax=Mycena metata TaxID=1033252 RepID=A0AAD7H605_9AGAR|nr:G-protein alpha subunit [Mycena metata]
MGRLTEKEGRAEKARSDAIDRNIREDSKRFRKEHKILVLGPSDSGKSTIVKQMQIVHQAGYNERERAEYRTTIYKNVLDCVETLARVVGRVGVESLPEKVWEHAEVLLMTLSAPSGDDAESNAEMETESVESWITAIDSVDVGADPAPFTDAERTVEMDRESVDSGSWITASDFLSSIHRIADPAYVPNEEDILHARTQTRAIMETRFLMGDLAIRLFDVGGLRSERKKWIHCFESVTSIIFCAALSDYDQMLKEDRRVNRMRESLYLFESVINSRWFLRTSVILFFTKIDLFKEKLPRIPLERYFPEYSGGNDLQKAVKYLLWKFMQENRARLPVYPHVTKATNTTHFRLVYAVVKETIQRNALNNVGLVKVYATVKEKIQRNTLKYTKIL